jgi:1-carboxybiuret hydrolase
VIGGDQADGLAIAAAVRSREIGVGAIVEHTLDRIARRNPLYNAFTAVTADRAQAQGARLDAKLARGDDVGPLAGIPFAVKNLFDVEGVTTVAGSRIDVGNPAAASDATVITRLANAGAVLVGALNMSQYAYGYTNENAHYGSVRNPHDTARSAGGSSGGSGAAVAGGLVPVALGSDTNGSIRVPASLCGLFGLKPTFGRLSRQGVRLFAASFDHVGPLARSVRDLAAFYDVMHGPDPADPACSATAVEPTSGELDDGAHLLRVAVADEYFSPSGADQALAAVDHVARALGAARRVTLREAARARAAAIVITAAESGNLHLENLKSRAAEFDPSIRDRFLAASLVPAAWLVQAQRFRRWYREQVREVFATSTSSLHRRRRAWHRASAKNTL